MIAKQKITKNRITQTSSQVTKVFRSGNSQAVRLPKEFQFDVDEVEILKQGEDIILRKKPANLLTAFQALASIEGDIHRQQPAMQERNFSALDKK